MYGFQPQQRAIMRPPPPAAGPSLPFITLFSTAETPITFGGFAKNGLADGLDWQNFNSDGTGIGYGAVVSTGFDDCTITLQGYPSLSTTKQYVKGTVFRAGGFTPAGNPEIELRAFTTISAHSIVGYEMDWPFSGNLQPVYWNGAVGDFRTTGFTLVSGTNPSSPANGDVIEVYGEFGPKPTFTIKYNGVQQCVWRDDDVGAGGSGYPGLGAFALSGTNADMKKWCFSKFEAGNW